MQENHFDVIVLGVGSMGSSTCYHLAKRGAKVLGLEQFRIPHERGSMADKADSSGRHILNIRIMFPCWKRHMPIGICWKRKPVNKFTTRQACSTWVRRTIL